jgi:hypothetical protein
MSKKHAATKANIEVLAEREPKNAPAPIAAEPAQEPEKETTLAEAQPLPEAQQAAPAAAETAKPARKAGGIRRLRELVINNPDITIDAVTTELTKAGFTLSPATISGFVTDYKGFLKVAKEMGKF